MFEVPYELPFIAITERAFTTSVNEQYEVLQRSIAIHRRLERLVLEEKGLDEVVRAIAATIGGAVCVLTRVARRSPPRSSGASAAGAVEQVGEEASRRDEGGNRDEFVPDHPELGARALVLPVSTAAAALPRRGCSRRSTAAGSGTSSG